MALRGSVSATQNLIPSQVLHSLAGPLQWLGFQVKSSDSLLAAAEETEDDGDSGWLASIVLALLIAGAIVAFCWMQRRERMIEQYAEEESRMRNTIAEAQADIDVQVDSEIAAVSAATGSSFTATAAALPRPSTGDALNQPPPARPRVTLPGCGPLPDDQGKAAPRASFAATARRSVVQRQSSASEYQLGDASFMTTASGAPTRKSTATSEKSRKSVADLAEARKSLVEVMQMYGPDEEPTDGPVSRTSLSGWYSEDKDKKAQEPDAGRERSLSSWYGTEKGRRVSVDPSKVVTLKEDGAGIVTVPSGVAQNLTDENGAAAANEEISASGAQGDTQ